MKDKGGREITVGCVVDVMSDGMLSAFVTEVQDGGLAGPDGRITPALLVVQIAIPMKFNPGERAPVYLVRESDKPAPEKEKPGPRRVH